MTSFPKISRRGWLALWLQSRRRGRMHLPVVKPDVPPAPVITQFETVDDGNGNVDVTITWTWDGLGWPDDGVFGVYLSSEDAHEKIVASVPGPSRSCSLPAILPAADIFYYCRVVYVKGSTVGAFSALVQTNPY